MIKIKQLIIGSHVSVDGERKEVKSVSNPWIFLDDDKPYHGDELDPIPLTAELLQELGFERIEDTPMWEWTKARSITISLSSNSGWNIRRLVPLEKWQALNVRYLHEAESFVYLTIGKELIDD